MTLAQEIYESLLKDPDLAMGQNQTRKEFAKQEAEQRAKQYYNNVEALSLAKQLQGETPIKKLVSFVHKPPVQKHYTKETPEVVQQKPETLDKALPPGGIYSASKKPPEGVQVQTTPGGAKYWIPEKKESTEDQDANTGADASPQNAPTSEASTLSDTDQKKLDMVMEAQLGANWKEDPDAQMVLTNYQENPKILNRAYNKDVINPIITARAKAKKDEIKQTASDEKTAEKAREKSDKYSEKVANLLPSETGDLDKLADDIHAGKSRIQRLKMFGDKEMVGEAIATKHARELIAHQKNHGKYMTEDSKRELAGALEEAHRHGADFDLIQQEQKQQGDNFGSPDHLRESNNKAIKQAEIKANYEKAVTGDSDSARKTRTEAFERSQANKYTVFDENGKPKHDTHIKSVGKGKLGIFDEDIVGHGTKQKANMSSDTNEPLSDHQLLHTLDPMQKKHVNELKTAKNRGDKEAIAIASKALEDTGIDPKDVSGENDTTNTGPPNPEVAKRKQAEGYMWHEETRHWILSETLKNLGGSHSGHNAALVSANHSPKTGGKSFALNEHGEPSDNNFVYSNGNVHKVGTGEPPKGGVIHHTSTTGNSLHATLNASGTLREHKNSASGVTALSDFTNPYTGSGKNTGLKGPEGIQPQGIKENFLEGFRQGRLNKSFETTGNVVLFYKQYNTHDKMKESTAVRDLLEFFDEPHIQEEKKRKQV